MDSNLLEQLKNVKINGYIDESTLLSNGYFCSADPLDETDTASLLIRIFKKRISDYGEPNIIILTNGIVTSKIWLDKGRVSRTDGMPADITYDQCGICSMNWFVNGRCINDEVAFICLKKKKDRLDLTANDIIELKEFFRIK